MGDDAHTRQAAYNQMFEDALSEETLEQIRSASNGNRALGEHGRERAGQEPTSTDDALLQPLKINVKLFPKTGL
jgi:hypothetical protein